MESDTGQRSHRSSYLPDWLVFVDAFAMDRLKTRWYFHMWSQCRSASQCLQNCSSLEKIILYIQLGSLADFEMSRPYQPRLSFPITLICS